MHENASTCLIVAKSKALLISMLNSDERLFFKGEDRMHKDTFTCLIFVKSKLVLMSMLHSDDRMSGLENSKEDEGRNIFKGILGPTMFIASLGQVRT